MSFRGASLLPRGRHKREGHGEGTKKHKIAMSDKQVRDTLLVQPINELLLQRFHL